MTKKKEELAILLLSCDGYSDLWDDFFNLKEKFWPDCQYKWFIVTESKDYERDNVEVIKCGKELNWAGRFRKAIITVDTPYVAVFLEDYFICAPIDSERINGFVDFMAEHKVDFLDLGNIFKHKVNAPNKKYYADHLVIIDKHLRYGLDTAAAIWEKEYLLRKIGTEDYSAWKFEDDRCAEAASEEGYDGLILCDDRLSFNVSPVPVVVQGLFYPPCIPFFKKRGYTIDTSKRRKMNFKEQFMYDLKFKASRIKHCRRFLKWIGTHVFGYSFTAK